MSTAVRRCFRCQAELSKESSYCLSCGCQNEDIVGKSVTAEFARKNQVETLKNRIQAQRTFGWLARFFSR